jgi:hypothetical protein
MAKSEEQRSSMPQPTSEEPESQELPESTMPIVSGKSISDSGIKGLSSEEIASLLAPKLKPKKDVRPKWQQYADGVSDERELRKRYPIHQQIGPVKLTDTERRCVSRGCSSPTYYKLQGIPYCSTHLIRLVNEMLIAKGVLS